MVRKKKGRKVSGWLILNKPYEMGSTKAVGEVRKIYQAQKAGHAGTLDPLATGLLPIALGEATKTVPYITDGEKSYRFTVCWGKQTNTDDNEGEIINSSKKRPSEIEVGKILSGFMGKIEQLPPQFSAIKIDGKRAYAEARAGRQVKLEKRLVHISALRLVSHNNESSEFEIECGKGTYIRSLARDMGIKLNCYGYIKNIHRTFVEPFETSDSISLESLLECEGDFTKLDSFLISPLRSMYSYSHFSVDGERARRIRVGNSILIRRGEIENLTSTNDICAVFEDSLLAIGDIEKGEFHPRKVLASHG